MSILTFFKKRQERPPQIQTPENTCPVPEHRLVSVLGFYADEARILCERVYRIMAPYPASVGHHENYPGGLWRHSIDVALAMAEKMAEKGRSTRDAFCAFVVGLLHDAGKIAFYQTEGGGYEYHPLMLKAKGDLVITGTRNDQKNHAEISAMLLLKVLGDEVKLFSIDEILAIGEAIRLHHSRITVDNAFLVILREVDAASVKDAEKNIITQEDIPLPEPEAREEPEKKQVLESEMQPPSPGARIDLAIWQDCLQELVYTKFNSGYHYYLVPVEDRMVLLLTYPKTVNEINEFYRQRTGMLIHDLLFVQALEEYGYVAAMNGDSPVVSVSLVIEPSRTSRKLKFLCLFPEKVLTDRDIQKYGTNGVTVKKFGGRLKGKGG
jgi:hypothetical protein